MQNTVNTRSNRYDIDLSTIKPFPDNYDYIPQVIHHLQDTKQNLSTKDLVILFSDDLQMSFYDMYGNNLEVAFLQYISNTHGLLRGGDTLDLYVLMKNYLAAVQASDKYYQNLLTINADLPSKSTINPKKLAVWRNTSKMGSLDTRQAVSVRKWIGSTLVGLDSEQQETLAAIIDRLLQGNILDNLDVRHHTSYEFNAWERAYINDAIRSCMNPVHSSCEVGIERTFTTYCSGYHGLPDNGLHLTVLYQNGEPVARAITFKDGEQDCYIRSYGDDRLHKWLQANGYEQSDFVSGTILYTTEDLLKPYVDGDLHHAYHYTTSDGKHYWELCYGGEYDMQTTDAYAYHSMCECCNNHFPDNEISTCQSAINDDWYTVCDGCYDENRYYVYTGGRHSEPVFFHDGYAPDSNSDYVEYDGEYYHVNSLGEYDLRLLDGEVYHNDDLYYCDVTDKYFTSYDDVYTDGDQISTTQPVHFPYDCVSREYWHANVVECACGTLALEEDTKKLSKPSLGDVVTLDLYWGILQTKNTRGDSVFEFIFHLDAIERDYNYDPTDEMKAFMDYAIAYNKIQYLRFQELGI